MNGSIFALASDTKKNKIILACLRIVDERGVKGLTVARIAQEVGFTESALYRHFKSKREIIELILDEALSTARAQYVAVKKVARDPRQQLRQLLRQHLGFLEIYPGLFKILYSDEIHLGEGHLLQKLDHLINELGTHIEEIIVQGKKSGVFKKGVDVSMAGIHFLGIVQTAFSFWSFKSKRESSLVQTGDRLLGQFFLGVEA
ncbi:MAG: TetR/AcrR family transcriptional regulator [Candidatus Aminicenantes bacterium]|nr:TetR/AcrR family transcriptional regulator [Candidatus Aminicenantes bacterium]